MIDVAGKEPLSGGMDYADVNDAGVGKTAASQIKARKLAVNQTSNKDAAISKSEKQ
jgi:hypothetical protein